MGAAFQYLVGDQYINETDTRQYQAGEMYVNETVSAGGGDPEAGLVKGKLLRGGLLMRGALVG